MPGSPSQHQFAALPPLIRRCTSPAVRARCVRALLLAALCGSLVCLTKWAHAGDEQTAAELASLSRQLDDNAFAVRQSAERRLTEIGKGVVADVLADIAPPPEGPYGTDRSDYFARIEATAREQLQQRFFGRLTPEQEVEGRLRLRRIRKGLTAQIERHVLRIRAGYPQELPEEQRKHVEGYTGGFRDGQQWFDASYRNRSKFVITAARIHLRMRKDGKDFEHEILVGPSADPIPPGRSGTWSAEVDAPRGASYELFWRTIAVYGFPAGQ